MRKKTHEIKHIEPRCAEQRSLAGRTTAKVQAADEAWVPQELWTSCPGLHVLHWCCRSEQGTQNLQALQRGSGIPRLMQEQTDPASEISFLRGKVTGSWKPLGLGHADGIIIHQKIKEERWTLSCYKAMQGLRDLQGEVICCLPPAIHTRLLGTWPDLFKNSL